MSRFINVAVLATCALLALGCIMVEHANAQFIQQGDKLVGAGEVGNASLGANVSLSADGNTALVGGPLDNGGVGAAWVYTRTGGVWSQQGNKLVGTGAVGNAEQGWSVALSADGNTAIVSGAADNNYVGAAWMFRRFGNTWTQQGAKLVGSGAVGNAWQGYGVSISDDGNTAIVGGPFDNNEVGAAWVYRRTGGVWNQQGSKLVGTGAVGYGWQGQSVSLSANGNTAVVGGPLDNGEVGAAWVFIRSGNTWTQQGAKLSGNDVVGTAWQGQSVSVSDNGNTAIVGGPGDNFAGATWVFSRSGNTWSQQGAKLVGSDNLGSGSQGTQGIFVSLSADGNTAIVGGSHVDNFPAAGGAWLFTRSGTTWNPLGSKLVGTGAAGLAAQGNSVAIAGDGNTAIVCGPMDNGQAGAAWVYVRGVHANTIGPVTLFVGPSNSNDNGRQIDLVVDLYKNDFLIATDTVNNQRVSGSTLNNSTKIVVPVSVSNVDFGSGDLLKAKVSIRRVGGGRNFGIQFWFNADSLRRNSNGWSRIAKSSTGGRTGDFYYFRGGDSLSPQHGSSGAVKTLTVTSTYRSFGTWSVTGLLMRPGLSPEQTSSVVPTLYALDQNYPNPFNPTTVIGYQLPDAGHVTLKVFDVLGKEVATLVDEVEGQGYKSVEWNARLTGGQATSVASGVYFYRLDAGPVNGAGSFTSVRKLLLLK